MKAKIQSVHFDADQKLIDFIQGKLDKVAQNSVDIIDTEVILKLDKNSNTENKVVEIKLHIPGNDLFAKKQCKSFEEATDQAVDALKTQMKKYREKIKSTNGRGAKAVVEKEEF